MSHSNHAVSPCQTARRSAYHAEAGTTVGDGRPGHGSCPTPDLAPPTTSLLPRPPASTTEHGMGKAVVPDLPYVRKDVPDDSEAPKASGRFAGLVRRRVTTESASLGTTEYVVRQARTGGRRVRRGLLVALTVTLASAVWLTLLTPATADDLTDRRKQIAKQITQTKHELSESSAALRKAGVEVARTQGRLDVAEAEAAQDPERARRGQGEGRRRLDQATQGPGRPAQGQGRGPGRAA